MILPSGLAVPDIVVADAGATADEDRVTLDADAVQLVVELVSPGNKTMDRRLKPLLYAEAAIPYLLPCHAGLRRGVGVAGADVAHSGGTGGLPRMTRLIVGGMPRLHPFRRLGSATSNVGHLRFVP
ncbi:Uma2 family endonuclease [Streptomyces ehimensis]|uniref:Uma2 family endonuclease n=1 Tax=Streptomyces ehimensis TaxID=68195 RepID=A0ABV9BU33_9ACTN